MAKIIITDEELARAYGDIADQCVEAGRLRDAFTAQTVAELLGSTEASLSQDKRECRLWVDNHLKYNDGVVSLCIPWMP